MELNISPQKMTLGQKIKCFFTKPVELFEYYKENPKWGLNLVLAAIIGGIFTYLSKIVAKDAYTELYELQLSKMPPDQVETARKSMEMFNNPLMDAVTAVLGAISIIVVLVLLTLIYFGLIKLFKGKVKFQQVLAVYMVTYWAMNISMVFKLAYTYFTHKMTYFNFMPTYTDALFNNLDLFVLWQSILLVLGFSAVAGLDEKKEHCSSGNCMAWYHWSILSGSNAW